MQRPWHFIRERSERLGHWSQRSKKLWWFIKWNGITEGKKSINGRWIEGYAREILGDKSEVCRGRGWKTTACNETTQHQEFKKEVTRSAMTNWKCEATTKRTIDEAGYLFEHLKSQCYILQLKSQKIYYRVNWYMFFPFPDDTTLPFEYSTHLPVVLPYSFSVPKYQCFFIVATLIYCINFFICWNCFLHLGCWVVAFKWLCPCTFSSNNREMSWLMKNKKKIFFHIKIYILLHLSKTKPYMAI